MIFNGLLKCDENLEIIADLAKSFKLSQTTTVFFSDANAALSALLKLKAEESRWQDWKLKSASIRDSSLLISSSPAWMSRERLFPFRRINDSSSAYRPCGFAG